MRMLSAWIVCRQKITGKNVSTSKIPPTPFPSEKKFTLKLFHVKNKNLISAVTGDKEREDKGI